MQTVIQRKTGFYWSIRVERRRKPGDAEYRYDYDLAEAALSGNTETIEEARNQLSNAKNFIESLLNGFG